MNQVHAPSVSCHGWGDCGQVGAVGTGFLGAPGDRDRAPVGGPGITGRGAGQNLHSRVCGITLVVRPVLPTVPKEAGAAEEQPEAKEALISTFLQG